MTSTELKIELKRQILLEDRDLIALNKYPSQLVQQDKEQDVSLDKQVEAYLKEKYTSGPTFCGLIHRLDRRVSGVCLFAKNKEALVALNLSLKNGEMKKVYWAITEKCPEKEEDTLVHFLHKKETSNKSFVVKEGTPNAKKAILSYKVAARSDRYFLLEVELQTGRHHQIRAQFAHIGCPIKGDIKYGAKRSNKDGSISLHAREMQFKHPKTNKLVKVVAPPPSDPLWDFFMKAMLA